MAAMPTVYPAQTKRAPPAGADLTFQRNAKRQDPLPASRMMRAGRRGQLRHPDKTGGEPPAHGGGRARVQQGGDGGCASCTWPPAWRVRCPGGSSLQEQRRRRCAAMASWLVIRQESGPRTARIRGRIVEAAWGKRSALWCFTRNQMVRICVRPWNQRCAGGDVGGSRPFINRLLRQGVEIAAECGRLSLRSTEKLTMI